MQATPYRMTPDVIRCLVEPNHPGAYILGDVIDGVFVFRYVGRSDHCLRTRLLTHPFLYEYEYFIFVYAKDAVDAFEIECKWWHDCKNEEIWLRNKIHPDSPSKQGLICPYCQFAHTIVNCLPLKKAS